MGALIECQRATLCERDLTDPSSVATTVMQDLDMLLKEEPGVHYTYSTVFSTRCETATRTRSEEYTDPSETMPREVATILDCENCSRTNYGEYEQLQAGDPGRIVQELRCLKTRSVISMPKVQEMLRRSPLQHGRHRRGCPIPRRRLIRDTPGARRALRLPSVKPAVREGLDRALAPCHWIYLRWMHFGEAVQKHGPESALQTMCGVLQDIDAQITALQLRELYRACSVTADKCMFCQNLYPPGIATGADWTRTRSKRTLRMLFPPAEVAIGRLTLWSAIRTGLESRPTERVGRAVVGGKTERDLPNHRPQETTSE